MILLGPSIQWRPTKRIHVDLVPLYGVSRDAPRLTVFLVFGFDFGGPDHGGVAPTSTRSR